MDGRVGHSRGIYGERGQGHAEAMPRSLRQSSRSRARRSASRCRICSSSKIRLVNAFTGGVEKPIIVLHSALVERLNDEETLAVIAHEVGHIHAEHVLYLTAAQTDRVAC